MRHLACALLLITPTAYSQCYVADSFKGHSVRSYNDFEAIDDGLSGQSFQIGISGDESRVVNSGGISDSMACSQMGANTIFCVPKNGDKQQVLIEVWSVYPKSGKVVYTKTTSGYINDGASLFTGKIVKDCS